MAATDDPIQNIQHYIHEVDTAKATLDKANADFKQVAQRFQKVEDAFEQHVAQFNAQIEEFTRTFDTDSHEAGVAVEHVGTLAQTHTDTNLTQVEHSVDESGKHLVDTANTAKTDIAHAHTDLQHNGFDAVDQAHHSVEQVHDTAHEHNEQHFGQFGGHVDNLDHQVENHESHLNEVIHHAAQEVTGQVTHTIEAAFSQFSTALHDTHASDLTQGVADAHEALNHAYEKFSEDASHSVEHLMDSVAHSLSDIGTHVGQEVQQAIQHAVEEAIEKAIEDLL
jgi:hypothetical protein